MSNSTAYPTLVQLSLDDIEEWRDIPGYEGRYQVSDKGRVLSVRKNKLLHPDVYNHYQRVCLSVNGHHITPMVHTFVALTFIGPRPEDHHIDHINRDKLDNRALNLRYLHKSISGAQGNDKLIGEKSPASKLTNEQRREIKRLYTSKTLFPKALSRKYGISTHTIYNVIKSKYVSDD